jgi:hypothetical protein
MSQVTNNPGMSVLTGAASIPAFALLKQDGTLAGADDNFDVIGVTMEPQATSGLRVPVRFLTAGTVKLIASEAIAAGDTVYKAASGKVGKTATNCKIGIALEAASADGSIFEVLPHTRSFTTAGKITTSSTADGAITTAGKIAAKVAVPGSFADLAAVRTYLASILT